MNLLDIIDRARAFVATLDQDPIGIIIDRDGARVQLAEGHFRRTFAGRRIVLKYREASVEWSHTDGPLTVLATSRHVYPPPSQVTLEGTE